MREDEINRCRECLSADLLPIEIPNLFLMEFGVKERFLLALKFDAQSSLSRIAAVGTDIEIYFHFSTIKICPNPYGFDRDAVLFLGTNGESHQIPLQIIPCMNGGFYIWANYSDAHNV